MAIPNGRIAPHDVEFNTYTPIASPGRELSIMFAFFGACVVTMVLYWFFSQAAQRRNAAKESARLEALAARNRVMEAEKRQQTRSIGHNRTKRGSNTDPVESLGIAGAAQRVGGRTGTSAGGLGFGDTEQDLIV